MKTRFARIPALLQTLASTILIIAIAFSIVSAVSAVPQTKSGGKGHPAPIAVRPVRGKYCVAFAPAGWAVVAENAQRVAFGADLSSGDGRAAAGYSVFAAGTLSHMRGTETPDGAVAYSLSRMGRLPTQFSNKKQLAQNTFLVEFQNSVSHGVAFYEVFPSGNGGYVIVMRTANSAPADWQKRGMEASAVARSLHCHVPNVPPSPDPPSLNGGGSKHKNEGGDGDENGGESNSLYNRWLDKEYYHNPRTGENFWVSPSHDWVQNGPDGPGYYAQDGNNMVKLDSGYAQ